MSDSNLIKEAAADRWGVERSQTWYDALPWLVGCNFTPSSAINQLEMWQAETFNPKEIDRELGWLAGIGMNTARVFLHDLLWKQDAKGFLARIDQFLDLAAKHKIRIMFVFFDSCWRPNPQLGPQPAPTPGLHNSYWVQSPGLSIVSNPEAFAQLEGYVTGVVDCLRDDERVLIWDLWNEPNNANIGTCGTGEMTHDQVGDIINPLLAKTFQWVRSARPSQPLTSGVWIGDWSSNDKLGPTLELQLFASDVISFHRYANLEETRASIEPLKRFGRPILCTEYLARGVESTFEEILPYFKQEKIGAYNWGAVSGKTQTIYPWDSWQKPYAKEPVRWHHDIFRADGAPCNPAEIALIKSLMGE